MARITVNQFKQRVEKACNRTDFALRIVVIGESPRHVRLRIFLRDHSLLDIYYNETNGKTAFAQIRRDIRIFGADNTHGFWHWHPRDNPDNHVLAESEITFEDFMKRLENEMK